MSLTKVSYSMIEGAPINVLDYGAAGDGVTDDSTALETVFNLSNCVIDGAYKTYKLTKTLSCSGNNIKIQNMTIDCSSIPSTGSRVNVLDFSGTQGADVPLTSNLVAQTSVVTVGNTSTFSAGQYVFIGSNRVWSVVQNALYGQIAKISSVDSGTQLTLETPALYDFATANAAYISPLTPKENIIFENVTIVGDALATNLQVGIDLATVLNPVINNCKFKNLNYSAVFLDKCINAIVSNCSFKDAFGSGLAYGVSVVNGCYSAVVDKCYSEQVRHLITIGGTDGVNLFVKATNNHATNCQDAGLDSHSAADFVHFINNTIEMGAGITSDGIILQCSNQIVTNNTVVGGGTRGIYSQVYVTGGGTKIDISHNNITMRSGSTGSGILVYSFPNATGAIRSIRISNNAIDGPCDNHIYVWARGATVSNVSITNNSVRVASNADSCFITARESQTIEKVVVSGNTFIAPATHYCVHTNGDSLSPVNNVTISNNILEGGSEGIRVVRTYDIVERGNQFISPANGYYSISNISNFDVDSNYQKQLVSSSTTLTMPLDVGRYTNTAAGTVTVTMPTASQWTNKEIMFRNTVAQAVNSSGSIIIAVDATTGSTAILPATAGAWALLKSNGSNWVALARGT